MVPSLRLVDKRRTTVRHRETPKREKMSAKGASVPSFPFPPLPHRQKNKQQRKLEQPRVSLGGFPPACFSGARMEDGRSRRQSELKAGGAGAGRHLREEGGPGEEGRRVMASEDLLLRRRPVSTEPMRALRPRRPTDSESDRLFGVNLAERSVQTNGFAPPSLRPPLPPS